MSFNEGLDIMTAHTLPIILVVFSTITAYFAVVYTVPSQVSQATADYARSDLLLGLQDPFFWFLAPLFALVSLGVVVVVNYLLMVVTRILLGYYSVLDYVSRLSRGKK